MTKISWIWLIFCGIIMIVALWQIESPRRECEARVCPNGGVAMILKQNCICMTPAVKVAPVDFSLTNPNSN